MHSDFISAAPNSKSLCVGVKASLGGAAQQGTELYIGGVPFQLLCVITDDLLQDHLINP